MTRNRASAKNAGTRLETLTAETLATHVDDRIERRTRNGNKDRGDIAGLRHMGIRITIECKNTTRINIGPWITETDIERGNDAAAAGIIIHKRHGKADGLDQLVTMTVRDLIAILTGTRPQ